MSSHGLRCYWRKECRCEVCRKAHADYERKRKEPKLQDTEFVMPVIKRSVMARLAKESDLPPVTLWRIKTGKVKRIQQATERKILEAA